MTPEEVKENLPFVTSEQALMASAYHQLGYSLDGEGANQSLNMSVDRGNWHEHFYIRRDGSIRPV